MASLNAQPKTSTRKQHATLIIEAKRKGIGLDELRALAGGSLRELSAADCSAWIARLSDRDLPRPPGQAPRSRRRAASASRRRAASPLTKGGLRGVSRMITPEQCDQIARLMSEYFAGDAQAATVWLRRNFKADRPRELATAKRGGEVIAVLKGMIRRRELSRAATTHEPQAPAYGSYSQPKGPSHAV